MPPIKILPSNNNNNNNNNDNNTTTTTSSISSFTTSISTNSLSSKHNNTNTHQQQTLTRRPTLTNLTRWVSRKISRQRLPDHTSSSRDGDLNEEEEEGRRTEDDYAAWCWAFSEGRTTGPYSHSQGNTTNTYPRRCDEYGDNQGYEYDHGYGSSYPEHGHGHGHGHDHGQEHEQSYDENLFSDFDGQSPRNDCSTGKSEAPTSADHGGEQQGGNTTNTRGTYTFLQNQDDRLGRHESSESVPADQLLRFTPIGHYGYSPLTAGSPVSPPPRILTPARYAETNRMEREKSNELKQKQKAQKGFWGPVRALWLSLRRSR
ncbi:hypothetical protein BDV27DRAFT_124697 [Aspergillus caelatus]|uniref:Uncharacterized protein n=1 Tax=Aspergillus caelatus TaxID=61420 RepID=A0A5N7AAU1_9EURO|nr:uncharacterized protein BDV27DRAFT_124697 [Aspergillus caelatus]KAE8366974.1 hypothetical protein BDV27DRAFT_124697 [Aspergillus caelatus]